MAYDPHDEEQFTARQEKASLARQQRRADWLWVLNDPRGRRVIADLIREFDPMRQTFVAGDPLATAFAEGRRSAGISLHSRLTNAGQEHLSTVMTDAMGWNVRDSGSAEPNERDE